MKVVALVSGGKDSCFAMMKCLQYGHEIVALANLMPADNSVDELDSYMYQTVGHQIVVSYATCMGVPLFRRRIQGSTRRHDLTYSMTPGDEVEDMFLLLNEVKRQIPSVSAVSSGAIASDYQRLRVESVCSRLRLVSLAYLWREDQSLLLDEMIKSGILAITVKVAAIGLNPSKHLGKELELLKPHLHRLKELYGINVCGEGGEYETLTLDCPLFKNARIVLDEFQVIRHSSDSIAPVGILHPLAFHLEHKLATTALHDSRDVCLKETDSVCEVIGDHLEGYDTNCHSSDAGFSLADITEHDLQISKASNRNTFSISCWLQDSIKTSTADLREDLNVVLTKIERQLVEYGLYWENVVYIHLYLSDMEEFATANETYVKFITQEKCQSGVPSRSTIELPLMQVGLGKAYIEVLVSNIQCKKVLHVQSVSCWAPSCIGPYSQATLHKEILHMAGQLGLDPATMMLCNGGPAAELEQALRNSEAVARWFDCSISTASILFVIYCSTSIPISERITIQDKLDASIEQMKLLHLDNAKVSKVLDPIFSFILLPGLPKSAYVEVKPLLYSVDNTETESVQVMEDSSSKLVENPWGFQHENWHDFCLRKCTVYGKFCAAILSVTDELAMKICSGNRQHVSKVEQMESITRFCIYRLDKLLLEEHMLWDDAVTLRFYFPTSLGMSHRTVSDIFASVFNEFGKVSKRFSMDKEPIFNVVPVLGSGRSATAMDDIVTCELFAMKS